MHFLLYPTEEKANSGVLPLASGTWAPGGDVGNLTWRIAKNNSRENYRIEIEANFFDDLESHLEQANKSEKKFGFTKKERKEIWQDLVGCEDKASVESAKYYDPMCSNCPEHREVDNFVEKSGEKRNEIEGECKRKVRNSYSIDTEVQEEIELEGVTKNWAMPELYPGPDCCDY